MSQSLDAYQLTVPQFVRALEALKSVITKANSHFADRKTDFSVVAQSRLVPDMFNLGRQIQIASDNAKFCVSRLTGQTAPAFEDKEQTFEDFQQRLDKTIQYLKSVKPEQFSGWEKQVARFPWYPGKHMEAQAYLVQHALPNFYFHCATAYNIVRANGVAVGKGDFLGQQDWKAD